MPDLHKLFDIIPSHNIFGPEVAMYKKRRIYDTIKELSTKFPVVTITGPRQSGKTTLAINCFPDYDYVSLEDPDMREFATSDARGFIKQYPSKTIIDEFQRVPNLTSYLQSHIDKSGEIGMYILTGSNQFSMMNSVSQSLAGRTAIIQLLPFSYSEICGSNKKPIEETIFFGGYPRIFDKEINPTHFYSSYFETYIQKDVRNLINVLDLQLFQQFVKMCAGRTGQLLNFTSFSNELGIDRKTVRRWISILESSYII